MKKLKTSSIVVLVVGAVSVYLLPNGALNYRAWGLVSLGIGGIFLWYSLSNDSGQPAEGGLSYGALGLLLGGGLIAGGLVNLLTGTPFHWYIPGAPRELIR